MLLGTLRTSLVTFYGTRGSEERGLLAKLYGVAGDTAEEIADAWLADPDALLERVTARFRGSRIWRTLQELALSPDFCMPYSSGFGREADQLALLGIASIQRAEEGVWVSIPLGLVAAFADRLTIASTRLSLLLVGLSVEDLQAMAEVYQIRSVGLSRLQLVDRMVEELVGVDTFHRVMGQLSQPENLGAVLVVIELGGTCLWQEVFAFDLGECLGADTDKVVPMMRNQERLSEAWIADELMRCGLLFRLATDHAFPLLVVPDEMRHAVWGVGRDWLAEWIGATFHEVAAYGSVRDEGGGRQDLQATLKWMICEIRTGAIDSPRVGFLETERTLNRLMSVGGETADYWSLRLGLAAELAIVQEDAHGRSEASKAMLPSLNGPRSCFVRDVLGEWCAGYLGVTADEPLARAVGLDENWRVRALEWMEAGSEFVPVWMRVEGLDAKLTGSGYLRKLEDGGREQFLAEFVLTHSLIWTVKLIWLDLVSCLGKGHWYSLSALTELMQLAMSFGIFGQVVQVLERPEECLYLPVQRSSFLADPFHSTEIASWVRQVITDLWEPLGIAKVCEETDQVWLDSPMMRIEGPPILDPAARREFLAEVMDNPDFEFHVPGLAPAILRAVGEEEQEGDWVEMSCPLDVILDRVEGRTIQSFDGKRLKLTSV